MPRATKRARQLSAAHLVQATDAQAKQIRESAKSLSLASVTRVLAQSRRPAPLRETKPGKERWSIKTGMDEEAPLVGKSTGRQRFVFVDTTVEELRELPRPPDMRPPTRIFKKYANKRAVPVEATIWRLEAEIVGLKLEGDGDMHVVLRGSSGGFVVAEAPTARPPFVGDESPWRSAMADVRLDLQKHYGSRKVPLASSASGQLMPLAAFPAGAALAEAAPLALSALMEGMEPFAVSVDPTKVRVTGVGFFDRLHGQNGGAPNGIELHPLLRIEFL